MDYSASQLTSLRVGGAIGSLVEARTVEEIVTALGSVERRDCGSLLVIGGGTNLVVSDAGFAGTVLRLSGGGCTLDRESSTDISFIVEASMNWDDLVVQTIEAGCTGVEMMSGIPGTVGAAPIQNIAAYGQQVCDVIDWVEVVDRDTCHVSRLGAEECGFGYRTSFFKSQWWDTYLITRVHFRLARSESQPPDPSTYVDIEKYFAKKGSSPVDLRERRRAVLGARRAKSMLLDENDPLSRSVGSFFVNPLVPTELADHLAVKYQTAGMSVQYLEGRREESPGRRRIPAAHLLRFSGFRPGDSWGTVKLSDKHLLALVTCAGATATDVWMVGSFLRGQVHRATSVELDFEAVFVGDFPEFDLASFRELYPYEPGVDAEPEWITGFRSDDSIQPVSLPEPGV